MAIEMYLRTLSREFRWCRLVRFQSLMPADPRARILDLGCGEAADAPWYPGCTNVVGSDIKEVGARAPYWDFVPAELRSAGNAVNPGNTLPLTRFAGLGLAIAAGQVYHTAHDIEG
jgi:hypothetical protein